MQNIDISKIKSYSGLQGLNNKKPLNYNAPTTNPTNNERLNRDMNQMSFLGRSQVTPSFKGIQDNIPDAALDKPSSYRLETYVPQKFEEIYYSNGAKDARFTDISGLKMSLEDLLDLQVDNTTLMSQDQHDKLNTVTEAMKDSGLGISSEHQDRFTGKGVKIAVIGQPLSPHNEYSGKILSYEKIGYDNSTKEESEGTMHAAQTVSMINGTNCGVAPDSTIAYYAADNITYDKDDIEKYMLSIKLAIKQTSNNDYKKYLKQQLKYLKRNKNNPNTFVSKNENYTKAIRKVIEENKKLPEGQKIPVISISWAFDELAPDYPELMETIKEATEQGIFVISGSMNNMYGINVMSADRNPSKDVNDPASYHEGTYARLTGFSKNASDEIKDNTILLPTEHRTLADYKTTDGYVYNGASDGSGFNAAYLAGMYALMKEANPDTTPLEFLEKILVTSDECHNKDGSFAGRLINPRNLLDSAINSAYVPSPESPFNNGSNPTSPDGKNTNEGKDSGSYIPSAEGVKITTEESDEATRALIEK
ncbi:S8/S53 family peptidase, partial [bacterium]|nr:S8/S53 family peptidase [bacterium]